ncbi:YihY/virulence factor BrkB family protein [Streptacidiphilus sp. ASG 303]|uniref:YihY/virulence factor BrkB family protein n=1 Tax=Streptacidiphilus sp. ASG 303 TaxID=2896847 RepID=UPI001E2E6FAD|nr:YihY/virulence factor BrkB family protein [Streptacidiphilus sp. ASG 303]MCD0483182.1 YihY/virulence factor BrkB family protein [Streptacidiphilus sp. ASG 303]
MAATPDEGVAGRGRTGGHPVGADGTDGADGTEGSGVGPSRTDEARTDKARTDKARTGRSSADEARGARPGPPERQEEDAPRVGPSPAVQEAAPDELTALRARSWWAVMRRTLKEFTDDELADRAAALTYYGVLAVFPGLLVLVSLLGVVGESATRSILDNVQQLAPGAARDILRNAVTQLGGTAGTGGVLAVVGLAGAFWSASGYVAAFIRASNAVYDIPEGRPVWKILPIRLAVTFVLMVMLCVSAVIVVFTGSLADRAGQALGIGSAGVTAWSIAKWPVLVLLVVLMVALLYWAAPNARQPGFRWISPGGFIAVALWLLASAGFALYVANFGSYNKTYGTLAGVIVFLVWLWISNLAILLGLEFDAETARQRAVLGGLPVDEEPYVEPRDTRKFPREAARRPTA